MYRTKILFFLVFVGSLIHLTICANNADPVFSKPKTPTSETSLVIFGKPISEVEESIKRFIVSLSKPTSKSLTQTLEKASLKGDNIKNLITTSTKLVVENLRSNCRTFGISNNENRPEIIAPQKDDSLGSNLILNGLTLICEIVDLLIIGSDLGSEFLFGNQTVASKFTDSNWKNPKYMDLITVSDQLLIYIDCLTKDYLMDDLKKAVDYGSAHSTNEVIEYLKKNIKKPRANRNFNTFQSVCSAIENIKPGGYEKCISDWDKIQSCFKSQTRTSSNRRSFLKFMKQLFPRKWVNSVVDLDKSCKLKKDQEFECKIRRRPVGTKRQVEYIVKTITGNSITQPSPLSRVIRQFSRVISRSSMAKSIVQDVSDYIAIYHQGEKRKTEMKQKSENDPKELKRYQKVSKSLDDFKKGVTQDLLNAIIESNQIPIYAEKSLRKATSKFVDWPIFSRALICLCQWINSLYENNTVSSGEKFKANKNYGVPYDQNSQGLIEFSEEFPDLKMLISKEQALDNLLRTMNQVSRENRALSMSSAFSNGLNNILLVLMFLETLSAVTILMTASFELQSSNGGGSVQNMTTGISGSSIQAGQGEIGGSSQETSEEDLRRKKRSYGLDSDITFVPDLPDVGILPLNNSTDFLNFTNNENGMNDAIDTIYETEGMIIHYENISVSRTESPKYDNVEIFDDDYHYSSGFNDTILKDGQKI